MSDHDYEICGQEKRSHFVVDHDYEPGDVTHPMQTDPDCRICGEPKRRH